MSNPYIGEIRMFAGNFAPAGWAFCNGQLLPISENTVLFALIGTTYGGDGMSTFALPDLQGRAPIHVGNSHVLGESGGVEQVTLTAGNIPGHTHVLNAVSGFAGSRTPEGRLLANPVNNTSVYSTAAPDTALAPDALGAAGPPTPQPHDNVQPFLCVNYIISLFGIFPAQA
jgi:microcystin-dependent protein